MIVSVAVRMVTDLSSSLLTIPVITRPSAVTKTLGWYSFDQSLLKACEANLITDETALLYSSNKGRFRRDLDTLNKVRGNGDSAGPSGLALQPKPSPPKAAPAPIATRLAGRA